MEKDITVIRESVVAIHQLLEELVTSQKDDCRYCRTVPMPEVPAQTDDATPPDTLFDRKAAAEYLLVDPRTVTRYRVDGKLRFILNEAGKIRYRESDLEDCYFWKWGKRS